ncbi:MAG: Mrp/NBP35 family ATP-binding protein [Bacillota bacterium]|nr:Mrp/NBP35 family ATP-binding protein [Bacillota bacterium]
MTDCKSCASRGDCPSASASGPGPDCPSQQNAQTQSNAQTQTHNQGPELARLHPAASIRRVFAIASGKGGVGKSTVTALLAVSLARQGLRVGVLDADLTGPSIPQAFGILDRATGTGDGILPVRTRTDIQLMSINLLLENPEQPVVWRGPVLAQVVSQFYSEVIWDDIDVLLVDLPPGTGDVPLTVYQSLPLTGLIMVATPQDLVRMIVAKAGHMAELLNIPLLGLIENMSGFPCPHCGEMLYPFGKGRAQDAALQLGVPLLAQLPINPEIARLVDAGAVEEIPTDPLEPVTDLLLTLSVRMDTDG